MMRRPSISLPLFVILLFVPGLYSDGPPAAPPAGGATAAKPAKDGKQAAAKTESASAPAEDEQQANKALAPGEMQQRTEQVPGPASQAAAQLAPMVEPGQSYLEIRYNVDGTGISGNKDRSFLNEGINHTSEVSAFTSQPIWDIRRFEFLGVHRYTDNPRVDPERNSLQRFYMRFTGPTFETNFGDALVNYSRFSFNQNIKGWNTRKDLNPNLRWTGTVGVFADRWGSIYRGFTAFRNITLDCQAASTPGAPASGCIETPPGSGVFALSPLNPTKPYTRLVGGTRLEQKFARTSWLAVNWSHGDDMLQSLPHAVTTCQDTASGARTVRPLNPGCLTGETEVAGARRPASEASSNHIVSGDANLDWQAAKLRVASEFAYSWTKGGIPVGATPSNSACASTPPVVGGAVLDSRCFDQHVSDWAVRADAEQRFWRIRWRVDYSRFQPDFFSANARQIRDLQDVNVRGELEVARQLTLAASWRRSNDNLNNLRNFTSIVRAPEGRIVLRNLPFYRRLSIDMGYRERNLDTSLQNPNGTTCVDNTSKAPTIRTAGACLGTETDVPNLVRRRSTRIPFLSVTLPVRDSLFGFDYEHRRDSDAVTPSLSADTDRFAFSYRGNYTWGNWDVLPSFRMEIERLDKNLPRTAGLSPTDPALLFPVDFFGAFDTNRSFQAGLLLEAPRYFRFEATYREFNSLTLSALRASTLLDPAGRFFYLNQGFKRPNWRAAATFKIRNDEGKTITFYYERANNFFDPGDPFVRDTKSFHETVIGGTILLRFRR